MRDQLLQRHIRQIAASLITATAVFLCTLLGNHTAFAQATYCAHVINVTYPDTLKIRSEPIASARIVGELDQNASDVEVIGSSGDVDKWVRVRSYDDEHAIEGWLNSKYIEQDPIQACTSEHLASSGIVLIPNDRTALKPQYREALPPFPNKCPYSDDHHYISAQITVSDGMLRHFQDEGFTLTTLCLAITSSRVQLDPETNTALPLVTPEKDNLYGWILLNVPPCFRNGTPLLDCEMYYHWFWGWPSSDPQTSANLKKERDYYLSMGKTLDTTMRKYIAHRTSSTVTLEYDDFVQIAGDAAAQQVFNPDTPAKGVGYILVASDLPRGYAYQLTAGTTAGEVIEADTTNLNPDLKMKIEKAKVTLAVPWTLQAKP